MTHRLPNIDRFAQALLRLLGCGDYRARHGRRRMREPAVEPRRGRNACAGAATGYPGRRSESAANDGCADPWLDHRRGHADRAARCAGSERASRLRRSAGLDDCLARRGPDRCDSRFAMGQCAARRADRRALQSRLHDRRGGVPAGADDREAEFSACVRDLDRRHKRREPQRFDGLGGAPQTRTARHGAGGYRGAARAQSHRMDESADQRHGDRKQGRARRGG